MSRKYTRMELFEELLDTHDTTGYGFGYGVKRPSQFWPDCQAASFDEIAKWRSDLRSEKEGAAQFDGRWGIGTSFNKSIDIDTLLRAFHNVDRDDRFEI